MKYEHRRSCKKCGAEYLYVAEAPRDDSPPVGRFTSVGLVVGDFTRCTGCHSALELETTARVEMGAPAPARIR